MMLTFTAILSIWRGQHRLELMQLRYSMPFSPSVHSWPADRFFAISFISEHQLAFASEHSSLTKTPPTN